MFTTILDRKIHYKKHGQGYPILFIHGWGGSLYSLYNLSCIASQKYTTYCLDLPGFGKSDAPPVHWGIEGYTEVVRLFIQTVIKKPPHFFGHSFGGAIGLYLSARYENEINKLVVCGAPFKRTTKTSLAARYMKRLPFTRTAWFAHIFPYLRVAYYRIFHRTSDILKFPKLEQNFRKIITEDLTQELHKIHKPVLIVWGENDTYTPSILGYDLHKKIKRSKLAMLPGKRHDLPISDPDIVWKQMNSYLSE